MAYFQFLIWSVSLFLASLSFGLAAYSVPDEPSYVELSVVSGDTISILFDSPLSDGGDPIQAYEVCFFSFHQAMLVLSSSFFCNVFLSSILFLFFNAFHPLMPTF